VRRSELSLFDVVVPAETNASGFGAQTVQLLVWVFFMSQLLYWTQIQIDSRLLNENIELIEWRFTKEELMLWSCTSG
jgi:hypothetical protein